MIANKSKKTFLVITLSDAEHLLDEATESIRLVYAGPRFTTDQNHLRTNNIPKTSEIMSFYKKNNILIDGIFIYADIFSLSLFRPAYDSFDINIVCIVGDTHHGNNPITGLAEWLIKSNIRTIALKQTLKHAIIFENIGFHVIRLPYYAHEVSLIKPRAHYFERMVFVGSMGSLHTKRTYYLKALKSRGLPIDICSLPRKRTFSAYNAYACAFNMPLNGDINYRIWETMAAGSVCLTESIPRNIEVDTLAKASESILTYSNLDDCCSKLETILKNPSLRMKIANNAYRIMLKAKQESKNLTILVDAILSQEPAAPHDHNSNWKAIFSEQGLSSAKALETKQNLTLHFNNIRFSTTHS